jgi:hypothetical protein
VPQYYVLRYCSITYCGIAAEVESAISERVALNRVFLQYGIRGGSCEVVTTYCVLPQYAIRVGAVRNRGPPKTAGIPQYHPGLQQKEYAVGIDKQALLYDGKEWNGIDNPFVGLVPDLPAGRPVPG